MEDDLLYPFQYGEEANRFFVNCSGLTYNHMRERTLVLSFLMFKVISIFVLKLSKFRKPNACRLMSLMSLLVASSLALENGNSKALVIWSLYLMKVWKTFINAGLTNFLCS